MIKTKQNLSRQEKVDLMILMNDLLDVYGEFYITKKGLRLFIKDNIDSLWKTLKGGDRIIFGEEAIGVITGYTDKEIEIIDTITKTKKIVPSRKYLTIITKDEKNLERLLRYISLEFRNIDIFCKIKINNPNLKCFYNSNWIFKHGRGKELLLCKSVDNRPEFIFRKFEDSKPEYKKRIK